MALTTSTTDAALVTRVAQRDQQAFSELFDRYRSVVFSLALRILRERGEAEEVLTDVFFQCWKGAAGFDPTRGTVASWLITLCRSRAIDRLRARGRRDASLAALQQDASYPAAASSGEAPDEAAALKQKRALVRSALDRLGEAQRATLELAYYGGLSHSEIAEKLGEPLGTVKTRIRQTLLALRESLGARLT